MGSGKSKLQIECDDYCKAHKEGHQRKVSCPEQCQNNSDSSTATPCDNSQLEACLSACFSCDTEDCTGFAGNHIVWTCPEEPKPFLGLPDVLVWFFVSVVVLLVSANVLVFVLKKRAERKNRAQRWGATGVVPPQIPVVAGVVMVEAPPPDMVMPQVTSSEGGDDLSRAQLYPTL